jgi:hypothetical protein
MMDVLTWMETEGLLRRERVTGGVGLGLVDFDLLKLLAGVIQLKAFN